MMRLLNAIFDTRQYTRPSEKQRARVMYGALLTILAVFTLMAFTLRPLLSDSPQALTMFERALQPARHPAYTLAFVLTYLLTPALFLAVRAGHLRWVALGPSLLLLGINLPIIFSYTPIPLVNLLTTLMIFTLLAGLTAGRLGIITMTVLMFVIVLTAFPNTERSSTATLASVLAPLTLLGFMLFAFVQNEQVGREEGFLTGTERQRDLSRTLALPGELAAQRLPLPELLNTFVHQVRAYFPDLYHVQVFLVDDERRDAKLVASTGEVGQQLLAANHSLPVGSRSVIGRTTGGVDPVLTAVGTEGSPHRPNDLLPNTVFEGAFPLIVEGRAWGALDVQSTTIRQLSQPDVDALRALAANLAVVLHTFRLAETQQRLAGDLASASQRLQTAQQDVERLNREVAGLVWSEYLQTNRQALNFDMDFTSGRVSHTAEWTPTLSGAVELNDVVQDERDGRRLVAVPLRLRGQVIGALELELDANASFDRDDYDLLREVSERLGVAAEASRLYSDSQRLAQREALVNEIGTRLQAANGVEATLNEATRGLRDALKANHVVIRLGRPAPANGRP